MNNEIMSQIVKCPTCGKIVKCEGFSGEKKVIVCPRCATKGVFQFSSIVSPIDSSSDNNVILIKNLTKSFNDFKAVDDFSIKIKKGEIFGFLGPNGAGKSTTIRTMLGLIHPTAGLITINGYNLQNNGIEAKRDLGYLPERIAFYENLTPLQTLQFFCELKRVDKAYAKSLIYDVGLENAIDRKVGTFSKGMLQLLGIAQTMIGDPSIYILDEPMSGLDARWVKLIREKIKMLNKRGATIMFSSHILSEVQNLCDRVAIINKGRLVALDTVQNLGNLLHIKPRLEIRIPGLQCQVPQVLNNIAGIDLIDVQGDVLYVTCDAGLRVKVITLLSNAGFQVEGIKTIDPSLEDAFVRIIGKDEGENS